MVICHACGKQNDTGERVGRRNVCEACGADLHVCLNCLHYDPTAYNQCREPQAERVLEKAQANFCDYFEPGNRPPQKAGGEAEKTKAKLDALFKKKK